MVTIFRCYYNLNSKRIFGLIRSFIFSTIFLPVLLINSASGKITGDTTERGPRSLTVTPTDSTHLDQIFREIQSIGTVNSLLIQENGNLLAESYFGRMNAERPANIKSASKSVLSVLVGIAIDRGYLNGVDQTLDEFFPDYFEDNPDSVKENITIEQMLTMRSGLETTSFRNYGRWVTSSNWVKFVLDQPVIEEPGGKMVYSTGTSHLLSVILTKATGMSTRQFANEYLFGPMGFRVGNWDRDPQGYYLGGNNMPLRPVEMIKIGQLMLDLGKYNGEQLVPREWIIRSVKTYTRSNFNPYDYGYMWWRRHAAGFEVVFAWGNGGQYIMILPELDTVLAITSDLNANNDSRRYQRRIFEWLGQFVVPYLENIRTGS